MQSQIGEAMPDARLEGFTVQRMADLPGAHELILGLSEDRVFGPTLLFGAGGTAVEVLRDTAIALPPLNLVLARDLMARTRIWRLLQGYRDRPAADLDGLARALTMLSQIAVDLPQVVELDINPMLASDKGLLALDARVKVRRADAAPGPRLAIRPRPRDLEWGFTARDDRTFEIRPIMPEDEPLIQGMIARSSPEDVRLRFFTSVRSLSHEVAARLTQIDYDREMALVAVGPEDGGSDDQGSGADGGNRALYGVVRIAADPNNERAEYGVMVRSDMKGQGLGRHLMQRIIDYARDRGIAEIFGDVLRENTGMLRLAEQLGFEQTADPDDPGVMHVALTLDESDGA
jgi:acetyltransferase